MKIIKSDNQIIIDIEKSIYNIDVLHNCFYWYGANFDIAISEMDEKNHRVELIAKYDGVNLDETISKIKRDLIDFKVRDTVNKETKNIRELIIAKAFAYYEENIVPTTELSDPVGFDPMSI